VSNLPSVHQWIAAAHRGDAIGDNARVLRDLFRSWGHESGVFAVTIDDGALTADGRVDLIRLRPIARLGYKDYASVDALFQMEKRTPEDQV